MIALQSAPLKASIREEQNFQEPRSTVVRPLSQPDQRFFFSPEVIVRVERTVDFFPASFHPYIKLPLLSVCLFVVTTARFIDNTQKKK